MFNHDIIDANTDNVVNDAPSVNKANEVPAPLWVAMLQEDVPKTKEAEPSANDSTDELSAEAAGESAARTLEDGLLVTDDTPADNAPAAPDSGNKAKPAAKRTVHSSFSTTPEVMEALNKAAEERKVPKRKLVEDALISYLGL